MIGTDTVLDLCSGDCDLAIRCAHALPGDAEVQTHLRADFVAVCRADLLPGGGLCTISPI